MDEKRALKRLDALKGALMEIFFAETIGGYHVEEAAEAISHCPDASIPHILRAVRLIVFSISDLLAFNFIEAITKRAESLTPGEIDDIAKACLDIYERRGLQPAVDFLKGHMASRECKQQKIISLDDEAPRFSILFKGISGKSVEIKEGPGPKIEDNILYMPPDILNFFDNHDENLLLLRITIFLKAAQLRYHTLAGLMEEAPFIFEDKALGLIYSLLDVSSMMSMIRADFPVIFKELIQLKRLILERKFRHYACTTMMDQDPICQKILSFLCERNEGKPPFGDVKTLIEEAKQLRTHWRQSEHPVIFKRCLPFIAPILRAEVIFQRKHLAERLEERFFEILQALYIGRKDVIMEEATHVKHGNGPKAIDGEKVMALINLNMKMTTQKTEDDGPRAVISMVSDPETKEDLKLTDLIHDFYEENNLDHVPLEIIQSAIGQASHHFDPRLMVEDQAHTIQTQVSGHDSRGVFTYDEWDFRRQGFRAKWCRLREQVLQAAKGDFFAKTLSHHKSTISALKRQFEALRQATRFRKRQLDGDEFDIDAVVEARADLVACGRHSQRLFMQLHRDKRDLVVLFLVDMSASTEGWVSKAIKESLVILTQVINATRDPYGIYGFSGMRRTGCQIYKIKGMDEPYGPIIEERINAIGPRDYTRMGASIRHATYVLNGVSARVKLLFVISDGKPEDYDEYKGPYAIEDTRHAVIEAMQQGIKTFCITIDKEAREYVPHIFGQYNYILVSEPRLLMKRMPEVYRRLTS